MDPWRDILATRAQYPLMSSIHRMVQTEGKKLRDTREVCDISEKSVTQHFNLQSRCRAVLPKSSDTGSRTRGCCVKDSHVSRYTISDVGFSSTTAHTSTTYTTSPKLTKTYIQVHILHPSYMKSIYHTYANADHVTTAPTAIAAAV